MTEIEKEAVVAVLNRILESGRAGDAAPSGHYRDVAAAGHGSRLSGAGCGST